MEWRSIRWTRAARLAGIAVGGVAAIALASAVVGSPEAPRLDRDIGLRVAAPSPLTTTPSEDPRLATSPVSETVTRGPRDQRSKPRARQRAERPKPPSSPGPHSGRDRSNSRGADRPAPAVGAAAPTPPSPPVAPPPAPAIPLPVAPAAPPQTGGGVEREFGFEN